MTPSNFCFRAAMLLVLAGMLWGSQMAITDAHSAISAHAHLNLTACKLVKGEISPGAVEAVRWRNGFADIAPRTYSA
jgi:hypothetical protein